MNPLENLLKDWENVLLKMFHDKHSPTAIIALQQLFMPVAFEQGIQYVLKDVLKPDDVGSAPVSPVSTDGLSVVGGAAAVVGRQYPERSVAA
jgi:hypothetical protein